MRPLPSNDQLLNDTSDKLQIINLEAMQIEIDNPLIKEKFKPEEWRTIEVYMQSANVVEAVKKQQPTITRTEAKNQALIFFELDTVKTEIRRRIDISLRYNYQLIDSIIHEYCIMGFANMDDYAIWTDNNVTLIPSALLTRAQKAGIAEVSQGQYGVKIKLHKKQPALDSLANILNILKVSVDLTNSDGSLSGERSVIVLPNNNRGGFEDES